MTTANQEYFSKLSSKYDNALSTQMTAAISRAVLQFATDVPTFTPETTVLDFGCGTGLVSLELAPHVGRVVGVDVSKEMVAVFNQRPSRQT